MKVWADDDWGDHEPPTRSPLVPAIRMAVLSVAVASLIWRLCV